MSYSLKTLGEVFGDYSGPYSFSNIRTSASASGQISMKEFINEKTSTDAQSNLIALPDSTYIIPDGEEFALNFSSDWMNSSGNVGSGSYVGSRYEDMYLSLGILSMSLWTGQEIDPPYSFVFHLDFGANSVSSTGVISTDDLPGLGCRASCADVRNVNGQSVSGGYYEHSFYQPNNYGYCTSLNNSAFNSWITAYGQWEENWSCGGNCYCYSYTETNLQPYTRDIGQLSVGLFDPYNGIPSTTIFIEMIEMYVS